MQKSLAHEVLELEQLCTQAHMILLEVRDALDLAASLIGAGRHQAFFLRELARIEQFSGRFAAHKGESKP